MNTPFRFVPFLRPMVWGGRRLEHVLNKPLSSPEPHGESWDVSDHPLHRSVVAAGPHAGRSLRHLMEENRTALLGPAASAHAFFPWLVKYLDANDWLSVQVHPDEKSVKHLWPGEGSKTEAWFVLDAASGSKVYAGLRPGTDEGRLGAALQAGSVADCLHSFEPRPGDCVFLPAGTVHAVGGGVLMAEVQQTSDATFRLFDWNRRDAQGKARALHIEEALACIDWTKGPVEPIRAPGFANLNGRTGSVSRRPLVHCPFFELDYLQSGEPFCCGGEGRLQLLVALKGGGHWSTAAGPEAITAGQAWVLPAAMPTMQVTPGPVLAALLCTLP